MRLTKTRAHKFNMGQYEHLELSATVEIDTDELEPGEDPAAVANEALDAALQEDVNRADQSSATPEDETYLHAWKDSI